MKVTKFKVEIHCNGAFNEKALRIITNHNEGKINVNLGIFGMLVKVDYSSYPTITPDTTIKEDVGNHTLQIIEGDKHTLTITECTYEELANVTEDDLTEVLN